MEKLSLIISSIVKRFPAVLPHLNANALLAIKAGGYKGIRDDYWAAVYDSVYDYLVSDKPVTSYKNKMSKAMAAAFINAAELGYEEGGGELPFDSDTLAWLGDAQDTELGHIADLFNRLKAEWDGLDPINEAYARADGYAATLDSIRMMAKMHGSKNIVLEFVGDDGKENCDTCKKLKGKRRKIKYILDNDLVPRPGNENFECKCYNCEHYWMNPKTGERFG
jgi:hypothetical protein